MSDEYIKSEALKIINILRKVGEETQWRDKEQTDRVFAWYEFDDLRAALGECPSCEGTELEKWSDTVRLCVDCGAEFELSQEQSPADRRALYDKNMSGIREECNKLWTKR